MTATPSYDVITVGSATQDVFVSAQDAELVCIRTAEDERALLAFEYGAKLDVNDMFVTVGGGAVNTSVTFSRFGLQAAVVCKVGKDAAGRTIRERLHRDGVGVDLMVTDPQERTGYSAILLGFTGDRTVLVYRGATLALCADEVDWETLARAKLLFVGSLSGHTAELYPRLAQFAGERGLMLAINPGSTQFRQGLQALSPVLQHTDVVFLNKREAYLLTGVDPESGPDDECRMCRMIHEAGAKRVVVTAGAEGADAFDGEQQLSVPAYQVKVAATLGAGDAFASACSAALLRGEPFPTALRLGAANAASVVQGMGAKHGILTWDQAQQWVAERTEA